MMVILITSDPHKWIRFDGSAIGFIGSVISGSVVLLASSLGLCHQKGKYCTWCRVCTTTSTYTSPTTSTKTKKHNTTASTRHTDLLHISTVHECLSTNIQHILVLYQYWTGLADRSPGGEVPIHHSTLFCTTAITRHTNPPHISTVPIFLQRFITQQYCTSQAVLDQQIGHQEGKYRYTIVYCTTAGTRTLHCTGAPIRVWHE